MKSKIISILTIISLLSCFFFMNNVKAETLQEQKEQNQAKVWAFIYLFTLSIGIYFIIELVDVLYLFVGI